jgi:hypothetical protein
MHDLLRLAASALDALVQTRRRPWRRGIGIAPALALTPAAARADVPLNIGYQGRLLDTGRHPLAGPVNLELRIFELQNAGTALYTEQQAAVSLVDGVFQVRIGTGTAPSPAGGLETALTGAVDRWFELVVNGEVLAPRQPFSAVPFAFEADYLGGKHLASLVQKNEASSISGHMLASGAVTTASLADNSVTAAKVVQTGANAIALQTTVTALAATVTGLTTSLAAAQTQIAALQATLADVTRVGSMLRFSGMNLQVVDGTGSTDGPVNGLGNLIVGYNEARGTGDNRTGSHNLIVGSQQNYASFGGFVAGMFNSVAAPWASVSGGHSNKASSGASSVSGGGRNIASGNSTAIGGGGSATVDTKNPVNYS